MTANEVRTYLWKVRPQGVQNQEAVVRSILAQPEHMQQLWLDAMLEGAAMWETEILASHDKALQELKQSDDRYWYDRMPKKGTK